MADFGAEAVRQQALTDAEFSAAVQAVTSAFGDPTRRQIYLYVRERAAGATASEVANHFALHSNVARHHLDKLAAGGYLSVFVPRPGGGAGRPSKCYTVSSQRIAIGPASDPARVGDDLLVLLLGEALSLLPTDLAESMAEQVGEGYGRRLAERLEPAPPAQRLALANGGAPEMAVATAGGEGGRRGAGGTRSGGGTDSFRLALHAIADALSAHGFAAHAEARGGSLALVREHCPLFDTAKQHPVICAVDRGMVRGMLAGLCGEAVSVEESSRALGDEACVALV